MGYVQDNLLPNEKVIFFARVHPAVFLPSLFSCLLSAAIVALSTRLLSLQETSGALLGILLLFAAIVFALQSFGLGIRALIIILTTEFAVTNRRIIAKRGFIRRHTLEMLLPKVESVSVRQGILGRLLNFGTVTVTGTGGTRESFPAIVAPLTVRKKIHQIIERYTQVYGQLPQASGGERL